MSLREKLWPAVSQTLAANGGSNGIVQVASTSGFYSGQLATLQGTALTALECKVLEVISATLMRIGSVTANFYGPGIDCSTFTTAASSTISAKSQPKHITSNDDIIPAVYENMPVTALRVMTVDQQGEYTAGSVSTVSVTGTSTINGSVTTALSAATFQYAKVANSTITAGNASITQAFAAATLSGQARIFTIVSNLDQAIGISLNGAQIQELSQSESFSLDLAAAGKYINTSTTVGLWNISATSTSGSIRLSVVY